MNWKNYVILKQGDGSTVELTDQGTILKTAHDHEQHTKLRNAVRFHKLLGPLGLAPVLLQDNRHSIEMTYIQDTSERSDIAQFQDDLRRNAIRLLMALKEWNVIHTDLTEYNYIIQKTRICPIDWGEARFGWEDVPNKRAGMDADWLYPSLLKHVPDTNRIIRKWLAISPHIKHLRGYGRVTDLGCLYGDISGMAASEGFDVFGVDNGAFDSDWLQIANTLSPYPHKIKFMEWDMGQLHSYDYDVVLMLSSWSHYIQQHTFNQGMELLERAINECGILFFENHLFGDGPGHENFKNEDDHQKLFSDLGAMAVPITTIPVGGRPFSRTVWKVTK